MLCSTPADWHPEGDGFGYPNRPTEPGSFPHGISLAELFRLDPLLADKVEAESETGCWIWTGAKVKSGHKGKGRYGSLRRRGKHWYAHRRAWALLVGPIPEGHDIHHRDCGETLCINPLHTAPRDHREHTIEHNEEDRRAAA